MQDHPELRQHIEAGERAAVIAYLQGHQFSVEEVRAAVALLIPADFSDLARALLKQLLQALPQDPELHCDLSDCERAALNLDAALEAAQEALKHAPQHARAQRYCEELSGLLERQGRLPGIFLNTVPKSGSVFIFESLRQGLGLEPVILASRLHLTQDLLVMNSLQQLHRGGFMAQEHLPALPLNLRFLERFLERWIVHLRDPRQATLSWVHHIQKYLDTERSGYIEIYLPEDIEAYRQQSLEQRIQWHLEQYYPKLIQWIQDWISYADSAAGRSRVLLTQYTDFSRDNQGFIQRLLDFFEIPQRYYAPPPALQSKQQGKFHFRKGSANEWKDVFTPEQQDYANALLPSLWRERLAWE